MDIRDVRALKLGRLYTLQSLFTPQLVPETRPTWTLASEANRFDVIDCIFCDDIIVPLVVVPSDLIENCFEVLVLTTKKSMGWLLVARSEMEIFIEQPAAG